MTVASTPNPTTNPEHLLTVVEPTPGGDDTLALAHDTIERGGRASVVMLVTDRVQRDIDEYAWSEHLDRGWAESLAVEQLAQMCTERIGADVPVTAEFKGISRRHVAGDVTAIAVPERLMKDRSIRKLARKTGLPVVVAPQAA